ncbi:MAG: hypothetical protein JXO72_01180 [Vicinamibacteria bacterium]|nr:hypothetical protein [Vicinamibacteria bacterium]
MSRITLVSCLLVSAALAGCKSQSCPVCPVCPTSTATPSPMPTPTPYVPPAPGAAYCTETIPLFEKAVLLAIDEVQNEHPEWFDFSGMPPVVVKPDDFQQGLIAKINAQPPLQAAQGWFDSWAMLSVKDSNELSEDYHIISSSYHLRKKYGQTCRPATF